ncbi:hypothetical protein D3C72_2042240 [compost metagenome]
MQISPGVPSGRLLPSSSLMAMAMPGNGSPIVPVKSRLITGLLVPMAQVSLMPQPSIIGQPVTLSHCLAVDSEAAMPPACDRARLEKSSWRNCGFCSRALNRVLTAGSR